jgi:hypothetical protein
MAGWQVLVDWTRSGLFDGPYDDITGYILEPFTFRLGCRAFELMADESTLEMVVDNTTRLFSPEYVGSPLFGQLLPQRFVKILYHDTPMWNGFTEDILPAPLRFGPRTATISCAGLKQLLDHSFQPTPLYQHTTADRIIADIIDDVGYPPSLTRLWLLGIPGWSELGETTLLPQETDYFLADTGNTTFAYFGDNLISDPKTPPSAYEVISQVVAAERGRFFFGRDGRAVFWNRHHTFNDTAPDVILDNTASALEMVGGGEDLANRVEVTFYPRLPGADALTLATVKAPFQIAAGKTKTLSLNYLSDTGAVFGGLAAQAPAGADFGVTGGTAEILTFTDGGQKCQLTIRNTGTTTVTVNTLNVKGYALVADQPVSAIAEDVTSIGAFFERGLSLDLKAIDAEPAAAAIALYELERRRTYRPRVRRVTLYQPNDGVHNALLISTGIGDLVRVMDDQTGHDRTYHLVGEEHTLDARAQAHTVVWELEPTPPHTYWRLNHSTLNVDTWLAY